MTAPNPVEEAEQKRRALEILRNVLGMVGVLHRRGYEQLRIAPGMSNSGIHWRCFVTPAINIRPDHGAKMATWDEAIVWPYTSANGNKYFNNTPQLAATPEQLAEMFQTVCGQICMQGRAKDRAYVVWYEELLRLTEPGLFPIAYADYTVPEDKLLLGGIRPTPDAFIRLPPPGLAKAESNAASTEWI